VKPWHTIIVAAALLRSRKLSLRMAHCGSLRSVHPSATSPAARGEVCAATDRIPLLPVAGLIPRPFVAPIVTLPFACGCVSWCAWRNSWQKRTAYSLCVCRCDSSRSRTGPCEGAVLHPIHRLVSASSSAMESPVPTPMKAEFASVPEQEGCTGEGERARFER
jgi:hypothetical protein